MKNGSTVGWGSPPPGPERSRYGHSELAAQNHADATGQWRRALIESVVPLWTPGRWCGGFLGGHAVEAAGSSRWAAVGVIAGSAGEPVSLRGANGLGAVQRGDPSEVEIRRRAGRR
jgi:hypothetical protein